MCSIKPSNGHRGCSLTLFLFAAQLVGFLDPGLKVFWCLDLQFGAVAILAHANPNGVIARVGIQAVTEPD